MKFKKIGTKMLVVILPVVILAMLLLTAVIGFSSRDIINDQIDSRMQEELSAQSGVMAHSFFYGTVDLSCGSDYLPDDIDGYL